MDDEKIQNLSEVKGKKNTTRNSHRKIQEE